MPDESIKLVTTKNLDRFKTDIEEHGLGQVNADWNSESGVSQILNKPTSLPASDTTSSYSATGIVPVNGTAVAAALGTLDVASVGGSGKYISTISETDGKISATAADMPTSLPASDTTSAYSATGTAPVNGTAVAAALGTLDVSAVGGSGKYIQSISETDGKISATAANMPTSLPASDVYSWAKASTKPSYTASEVGAIATSAKGAASGVAELDSAGKVPSSQLPSFVDDVLEYDAKSSFPTTGETGKIYVDKTTNLTWRWSGTAYVEISPSLALGETSSTAYRGDRGKTAYTHATDSNRLTTAKSEGLYKIATTAEGHVKSVTAVAKSDITGLGIPAQDTTYSAATQSAAGLMSAADKTKLDGVATGAEVNQNAFSNVVVGSTTIAADGKTDTLTLVAGSNVTLTPDATNDKVTIAATDTTYSAATQSAAGLMSAADKTKLDGIASGAQVNAVTSVAGKTGAVTLAASDVGLGNVGNFKAVSTVASQGLTSTEQSNARANIGAGTSSLTIGTTGSTAAAGNHSHSAATTSAAGFMSATDKSKLDGIAEGATANTGTVTQVKVGSTAYNPTSGVVSLPAYPTTLPASDVYAWAKASTKPTYTASDVGAAASSHNQASNTINAMTGYSKPSSTSAIAATDTLNGAIGKLEKALDGKGTSSLTIGTTATTAAAGNHTHTTSIAASTGTNQITLAANTKYALTAGGTSYVFTTPPDTNTTYTNEELGNGFSVCYTEAEIADKVADLPDYKLTTNGQVSIRFANSVPNNATLNINSQGAKNIYYKNVRIASGIINAGDIATFVYDGGQYQLVFVDHTTATTSAAGLMSAADKTKLDGVATGATANIGTVTQVKVGTTAYNPSSGIVSLPAYPSVPVTSVAGKTGAVTLSASDVGLGNVGNFKAVSTAASQGLTTTEQTNARANLGLGTAATQDVTSTYSATGTAPVNGTAVASAIAASGGSPQVSVMPTADSSQLGKIYQYVGETGTYTNGYFYKCIENSGTYGWVNVMVQGDYPEIANWSWSNAPDEYVKKLVEAHRAGEINLCNYWAVGDERTVHLGEIKRTDGSTTFSGDMDEQDIVLILMDTATELTNADSTITGLFFVGQKECLSKTGRHGSGAVGGTYSNWGKSGIKSVLNSTTDGYSYYKALPVGIRELILKRNIGYKPRGGSSTTVESYITLFSQYQVLKTSTGATLSIGNKQLSHFKTTANRIKHIGNTAQYWWLIETSTTEPSSGMEYGQVINTSGALLNDVGPSSYRGVVPYFMI